MRLRYRRGGQAVIVLSEGCKRGREDSRHVGVVEQGGMKFELLGYL